MENENDTWIFEQNYNVHYIQNVKSSLQTMSLKILGKNKYTTK